MDLSVFFAGTAGSTPSARRGLPAILVRRGGESLLFDCGEGTQRQLIRSVGLVDLEAIFITHFHADHWLGLPGMLKSFGLREREAPLAVYGPPGLRELMDAVRFIYGRLPFELTIEELQPTEPLTREGYAVVPVPVQHGGTAFGYAIVEDTRRGRLDPEVAQQLGVAPGPDFGRLTRGETVNGVTPEQVLGPERHGRKIVISGDTRPTKGLAIAAHRAELLVHESTFAVEEAERARQTNHSTAREAADLARESQVSMLALTHISGRYFGRELAQQAQAAFAPTVVARDFDTIEIPFPEHGLPRLLSWSERRALERPADTGGEAAAAQAVAAP